MKSCRRHIAFVFFLITFVLSCHTQDTLNLQEYINIVAQNHPLIQKAYMNDEITAAEQLKGKGALDPKIISDYNHKQFNRTDYFTIWQSEAKIPTILPIDFSLGYERNDGDFLNTENSVPSSGLLYGTINVSLLRGFIFDDQRYNIQAAELKGIKSQIEKEILLREIVYQAVYTYLNWASKVNAVNINQDFLKLLTERHQNVIQLFKNGDSPAIDTLESRLNLNTIEKSLLDSRDMLIKAEQKLSLFIWDNQNRPLQLSTGIQPMKLESLIYELRRMSLLFDPNFDNDPLIAKINNEIDLLDLDNRLEKENLKPQLDLKYNTIVNLGKDDFDPSFTFNDYKYGVAFQYPIFNRKSRGQIKLNEVRADQNELEKAEYIGELSIKFQSLQYRQIIQEDLLQFSKEKIVNSLLLYEAEKLKFEIGESSIFLLNQRERKLLEAQLELIKSYSSLGQVLNDMYYLKLGQLQ